MVVLRKRDRHHTSTKSTESINFENDPRTVISPKHVIHRLISLHEEEEEEEEDIINIAVGRSIGV
jgi:hypothetical protein